ncbi:unnamed protein product [Rotaria sp. Silwood2]|nr:unnamed protein product [Rotaria sp. Silwood2]
MERIYENSQPKSSSRTSLDEEVELDTTFEYNSQEDSDPAINNSDDDLESGYDSSSDCDEDRLPLQYLKGYQTQSALYNKKIYPDQLLGVTQYDNSVPTTEL